MNEMKLSELIDKTKVAIKPIGYSNSTVYQYGLAWEKLTIFFALHDQIFFSIDSALLFLKLMTDQSKKGDLKEWRFKLYKLSTYILIEVFETGSYSWKYHKQDPDMNLNVEMKTIQSRFLAFLEREEKRNGTKNLYMTVSRQILKYLQIGNYCRISKLKLSDVSGIISHLASHYQKTSMRTALSALRVFFRYLRDTGQTTVNLALAVPSNGVKKIAVVPTLTAKEEDCILQSIDRNQTIGKRNYAMILLAIRTGLRESDVINLRFSEIDWHGNTINIVQQKNDRPLVLPLLPEVGNALADYILNGRPAKPGYAYIFLRIFPPFIKLTTAYTINSKTLIKAGVRAKTDLYKGFHLYRHSIAARMLAKEIPLHIISDVMGHSSKESSKQYLFTDGAHLKECALSLKGIEPKSEVLI